MNEILRDLTAPVLCTGAPRTTSRIEPPVYPEAWKNGEKYGRNEIRIRARTDADIFVDIGTAAHECVSEEALVHLKSYKYSSVDKSLISKYILQHYVRKLHACEEPNSSLLVERVRQPLAVMASTEHGNPSGFLLYPSKCDMLGDFHARPSWTGKVAFRFASRRRSLGSEGILSRALGSFLAVL